MRIEELIRRSPVTVLPGAPVAEAARLMKEHDVGSVVVVEEDRVVGILTDRDIVVGPVAENMGPTAATVAAAMTPDPVTVTTGHDLDDCLERMAEAAVRRAVITNDAGDLLGVVALDDILMHLSRQLGAAAEVIRKELVFLPSASSSRR